MLNGDNNMSTLRFKGRVMMEFFYPQESLTAVQWILRAIIAFFFLLIAAKIMGQRSISQLRLLDFAMAISVGNIIAHPLSDEGLGMKGSMITMAVLVGLYIVCVFLSNKWVPFKKFVDSTPMPLIKNGEILSQNLRKARISVDFLLTELRKEKVEDIQKVAFAFWEPDGSISSFLYPEHQTTTRADLSLPPQSLSFPSIVIKEGKIDYEELKKTRFNEEWLKNNIKTKYNVAMKDILLAQIDQNDNLYIFLK